MNNRVRILTVLSLLMVALGALNVPVQAQDGPTPLKMEFAAYEGNPVLSRGSGDEWDAQSIHGPSVVFHDDLYYMFYAGDPPGWSGTAIGYATSVDGLAWEKYAGNPVFEPDGTGFDAEAIIHTLVMVEGDTWVLYYMGEEYYPTPLSSGIGRATAPSPSGPWTREEEPVLTPGSSQEWDNRGIAPISVTATGDGYAMYYIGGALTRLRGIMIGMATSPDGIHWTKYDDPTTTDPPYSESDPVLQSSPESWDTASLAGGCVMPTAKGWEMFYSGAGSVEGAGPIVHQIGYATSEDGIYWAKYEGNPLLTSEDDPAEPAYAHADLDITSVIVRDSTYLLYYDYFWEYGGGVGVATGTVTYE